jgi:tRNA A-37 threonylcarbamoyl transferase component Bud32
MNAELVAILKQHYPPSRYVLQPLTSTSHYNVLRIIDTTSGISMIGKGIFHIHNDPDLGPDQADKGFLTETHILSQLPAWWGIYLIDAFRTEDVRVVITPELSNQAWSSYKPSVASDRDIANTLNKQLRWLREHNIAHGDIELKNIMLTPKGPVIIDFEKSKLDANTSDFMTDVDKLIYTLREHENTRRIGDFFAEMSSSRRKSIGGRCTRRHSRRRRSYRRR